MGDGYSRPTRKSWSERTVPSGSYRNDGHKQSPLDRYVLDYLFNYEVNLAKKCCEGYTVVLLFI